MERISGLFEKVQYIYFPSHINPCGQQEYTLTGHSVVPVAENGLMWVLTGSCSVLLYREGSG
jgi:hypothetical protein